MAQAWLGVMGPAAVKVGGALCVPCPRGGQQRPVSFLPQGQGSVPPPFQPGRPLRTQNGERKAKDSSGHPLCPRTPPCISTQCPATSPLYQVCFLQFCPLGRHDGGGQSVLKFPTSPRWAPVTRPLSYADYRPRQGQDDHLSVCGTAEVTMPRAWPTCWPEVSPQL